MFLLLILRIPYWLLEIPLLQPELVWMLIGERMSQGHSMYVGIVDDMGPLSAGVYWLLHLMVGKSLLAYKIAAGGLILFQIGFVNNFLIQFKAFEDNSYIPALVMTVFFHLSFDFLTLSPALMGSTFVILALAQLFSQTVRHQDQPEPVFLVGLFFGIALCFHFPLIVYLPFLIIVGIVISGFNLSQLILCMAGYFLPLSLIAVYYFWIDGLTEFLFEFAFATRLVEGYHYVSYWDLAILFAFPLSYTLVGFVIGSLLKRLTVNQQKQNQLIILYMLFSLVTVFISNRTTPYQWVVILPGMAYYTSQIFIYLNRKTLRTALFYIFLFGIPMSGYLWVYQKINTGEIKSYAVGTGSQYGLTNNATVLVLGEDMGYYRNASLAGPYLNYRLSKPALNDYKNYPGLTKIYASFKNEKPEYVIDEEGIFATLLEYLPEIEADYALEKEGVYKLK